MRIEALLLSLLIFSINSAVYWASQGQDYSQMYYFQVANIAYFWPLDSLSSFALLLGSLELHLVLSHSKRLN